MIFGTWAYVFSRLSMSWADVPPSPVPGVSFSPVLGLFRACVEKSGCIVMAPFRSLYGISVFCFREQREKRENR